MPPSAAPPPPLIKHNSWSPDAYREEAWQRRKGNHGRRSRRIKSVTDEDLDELKACIELGFGFESPKMDQRLSDTFPALGLYYAVNKRYNDDVSKSSSSVSDCGSPSSVGSPHNIFGPGENPQTVKTRLRQWAQVVACSVRQSSG
ncbi:Eukaryotic translation initiation factor 3 subunit A like [Actinidia chinensis var. chinensis]|uniref:Eukaryotic translation initiation factor 3 subunit A like n=1 Tax=Actinidia chinensis var. chinensis TaxID=1590841 RepID=A0A2R6R5J3_ACTCC|nr:Eukaryotic translation initiation factor 3 subunit A like [Actinidia chinensis var. chinensis]